MGGGFSWGVALRKAPHGAASGLDSDTGKKGLGALGFRGGEAKAAGGPLLGLEGLIEPRLAPSSSGLGSSTKGLSDLTGPITAARPAPNS